MGLVTLFNDIDVLQTRDYIKISVETYITRMSAKHLITWMDVRDCSVKTTPLLSKPTFIKTFLSSVGDPDETQQKELAARMGFGYRSGIGEIIYALITARPDVGCAIVRCAQYLVCQHETHYHAVRQLLKYLYITCCNGIYYWRTPPF